MEKYILSLDQGTTSSRAVLINNEGKIISSKQKEFKQSFPKPGWVEHDPNEIWSSLASVITQVLIEAGVKPEQIQGIGITNQRETTIVWDRKTSKPIYPAIVWQDRRTAEICKKLKKEGLEKTIQKKTGLLLDPYFSGTKLQWILENVSGAKEKASKGELAFGTVDSWIVWKLTSGQKHITDGTNASRTLLYNIEDLEWDEGILKILKIPRSLLPEVHDSSEVYGNTNCSLFSIPIPISGIAGDQQAALFGQACFEKGMVKATYGTGCFLLMNTGEKPIFSMQKLLTTIGCQLNGKTYYALEGSVFIGGAVIQWLRDGLNIIRKSKEVEKLAASVQDNGGVYFVPAFTGLGAPHWNPSARGTILGITRGTSAAHIARAALEGIAFQATDLLMAMQKDADLTISDLRVDGGVVASDFLMQFQSDLMNIPVQRPNITELTALGVGFLAGLSVGFWKDQKEIASFWELEKKFQPKMPISESNKLRKKWDMAIKCAEVWEAES